MRFFTVCLLEWLISYSDMWGLRYCQPDLHARLRTGQGPGKNVVVCANYDVGIRETSLNHTTQVYLLFALLHRYQSLGVPPEGVDCAAVDYRHALRHTLALVLYM
jgi:hypothetical protein